MAKIIILRHGHNFSESESPRRVGCKTNLSLAERGKEKIQKTAHYLAQNFPLDKIITASLRRTIESAEIIKQYLKFSQDIIIDKNFDEIDYGPDENKTEEEVIKRIGKNSIIEWEKNGILPDGWVADIEKVKINWQDLANNINNSETILVVTSAGIAKFAPYICEKDQKFYQGKDFKINPGNLSLIEKEENWQIKFWNFAP